ncbi:MAG: hypothetical protein IT521_02545 [Burkholderiales bacterium]|nr:hypothetical protein [Burkholderiales bacterium]
MKPLAIAVMTLVLAACAGTSTSANDSSAMQAPRQEKKYRTGSHIPVRDPLSPSSSPTTIASPSAMQQGAAPPAK